MWWHSGGRTGGSPWILCQPGLYSKLLDSQDYTVTPCLKGGGKRAQSWYYMPVIPTLGRPRQGDFKFSSAWATYCIPGQFKNSFYFFLKWKLIQNKIQSSFRDLLLLVFAKPANTTSVSPLLSQVSRVYFARAQKALASSSGLSYPTLHSFNYSGFPQTRCTLCSRTVCGTTEQGWPKADMFIGKGEDTLQRCTMQYGQNKASLGP